MCWTSAPEEKDNEAWRSALKNAFATATAFEIHCWNEETEWIALALQYGKRKDFDWPHGVFVSGAVTPEFVKMVLTLPKPYDTEIYNKMTPFFSIFLDNGFGSETTERS